MSIKIVVAVTDRAWFEHLRAEKDLAEVNFWSPSDRPFKALGEGELFLFKLHAPDNYIVGGGVFLYSNTLPCSLAWEAFGTANGADSLEQMRTRVLKYRRHEMDVRRDFAIGCRILTQPFFWEEALWIRTPPSFSATIVSFKTYDTSEQDGAWLWREVDARVRAQHLPHHGFSEPASKWGNPVLVTPRLGQGAFRVLVTDAYGRRCAVTAEKTLPALEAAHIRPYSTGGDHRPTNGILLRRDLHSLFDLGYVTITPEMRFQVSRRIRDEYENGRDYYAMDGRQIRAPLTPAFSPDREALAWHNEYKFLGG